VGPTTGLNAMEKSRFPLPGLEPQFLRSLGAKLTYVKRVKTIDNVQNEQECFTGGC
jgi:hypothetical protein